MGVRDRAERRRSLGKERLGAVGLGAGGWTPFPRRPRAPPEAPCAYKEGGAARFPWSCGVGDGRCRVPGCFGLESCWLRRRAATEAGLGDPCGPLWFGGVACLYRHESSSEVAGSKRSPSP